MGYLLSAIGDSQAQIIQYFIGKHFATHASLKFTTFRPPEVASRLCGRVKRASLPC
jgi:hypothetical protein